MMAISPANETRDLIEVCESHQYTELIKEPTRVTSSFKSLVNDIPVGKAAGFDGIPASLLKLSFTFLVHLP